MEESYYTTSYYSDSFDEIEVPVYFPEDSDESMSTTEEEERDKKLGRINESWAIIKDEISEESISINEPSIEEIQRSSSPVSPIEIKKKGYNQPVLNDEEIIQLDRQNRIKRRRCRMQYEEHKNDRKRKQTTQKKR